MGQSLNFSAGDRSTWIRNDKSAGTKEKYSNGLSDS